MQKLNVNAIYLPDEQWQMFETACDELGYSLRSIAKNALQGFFAANRQFYVDAALRDAQARQISQSEHYRVMKSGDELPRVIEPATHPPTPISWVPDLQKPENKRRYNTIEISNFNYVLLRVAILLDGGSLPVVVSKCIYAHLGDDLHPSAWVKSYLPQIIFDQKEIYKAEGE